MNEHPPSHYEELIRHLNGLAPIEGWFTQHYGGVAINEYSSSVDGFKKPWQRQNTQKLDAIRKEIDEMGLSETEKCVLLTSLIHALDAVDNTIGHFASYLNEWSARSHKPLTLRIPALLSRTNDHQVHQQDIFDLLPKVGVDLAYLDPPYGSNNEKMPPSRVRYSVYYHLWTSIVLNDSPKTFGKAKRRADSSDTVATSVFEEFRRTPDGQLIAVEAIRGVLKGVQANHVLLSYSSGGRATADQLREAIHETGKLLQVREIDYRRNVMAGMRWTNEWVPERDTPNREYLFLIEKG